jgi:hypothetical protein
VDVEHLFEAKVIFGHGLGGGKFNVRDKLSDAHKKPVNFLFERIECILKIVLNNVKLLAEFVALYKLRNFLLSVFKGPLIYRKGPAFTRSLGHIMGLIKNQDTVLDDFLVLLIQLIVEQVVVGHQVKVANWFDKGRVVIRTEVVNFCQLLYHLGRNYFVFELVSSQGKRQVFPFEVFAHCLLNFLALLGSQV